MKPFRKMFVAFLVNSLLVVASLFSGVVIFELALRVFVEEDSLVGAPQLTYDVTLGALVTPLSPREKDAFRWDGDGEKLLHRKSENRRLVYEMRPSACINEMITTNADGFRDVPFRRTKEDNTRRIVVVGDSITFGWYEQLEETYPKVLEFLLNRYYGPDTRYEVYNMGVGGYDAAQEVELIRTRTAELRPDLVILQYCVNDAVMAMDAGLYDHFSRGKVQVLNLLRRQWKLWVQYGPGKDLIEKHYPKLADWQKETGIPLVIVFFPAVSCTSSEFWNGHKDLAEGLGLTCFSLESAYSAFPQEQVYLDCYHPNTFGHRIAAEEIFGWLAKNGVCVTATDSKSMIPDFRSARDHLAAGFKCLQSKDYEGARLHYDAAVQLAPDYARYTSYSCLHAAARLREERQFEDGLQAARLALTWAPGKAEILLEIARNLKSTAGNTEILEAYKEYIASRGDVPPECKNDVELAEAWEQVGRRLADINPVEAHEALEKAIRYAPWFSTAYEPFENYFHREGNIDGLVQTYEALLGEKPMEEMLHVGLVRSLLKSDDPERAQRPLETALSKFPDSNQLHMFQADYHIARGNRQQAARVYEKLLAMYPEHTDALLRLGMLNLGYLDFQRGMVQIRRILDAQPTLGCTVAQRIIEIAGEAAKTRTASEMEDLYAFSLELCPSDFRIYMAVAEMKMSKGDLNGAFAISLSVLTTYPDLPELLQRVDHVLYSVEDPIKVEAFWRSLVEARPDSKIFNCRFGSILKLNGKNTEARIYYEKALKIDSKCVEALYRLGLLDIQDGAIDIGMAKIRTAIKLAPDSSETIVQAVKEAGTTCANSMKHAEARALFDLVSEISPSDLGNLVQLARACVEGGDFAKAETYYDEVLRGEPDLREAADGVDRLYESSGDTDRACTFWRDITVLHPGSLTACLRLAAWLERSGAIEEARSALTQSLDIQPQSAEVLYRLGVIEAFGGTQDKGLERLRLALSLDPGLSGVIHRHIDEAASRAHESGRLDTAQALYEVMHALFRDDPWVKASLGRIHEEKGNNGVAASLYAEILTISPEFPLTPGQKQVLIEGLELSNAADTFWRELVEKHPDSCSAYCYLGIHEERGKRMGQAGAAYKHALKMNPMSCEALYRLGALQLLDGNRETGLMRIKNAVSKDPSLANQISARLGEVADIFRQKKDPQTAVTLYQTALDISPSDLWPRVRMGEIYEEQGDNTAALDAYRAVLNEKPESPVTAGKMQAVLVKMLASPETVLAEWKALAERHPGAAVPLLYLADALEAAGATEGAEEARRSARQINPEIEKTVPGAELVPPGP